MNMRRHNMAVQILPSCYAHASEPTSRTADLEKRVMCGVVWWGGVGGGCTRGHTDRDARRMRPYCLVEAAGETVAMRSTLSHWGGPFSSSGSVCSSAEQAPVRGSTIESVGPQAELKSRSDQLVRRLALF
ncbi:unnamed protein product [Protopolystoma xenopodis]|uniref:Uncharacterized protein n=1 Tax=Protopolystoma xenopodis TaxID=117903 RepID=A0A448WFX5_9PLAT|nr:unnamed protein product [Protopolystoma xenopodis]